MKKHLLSFILATTVTVAGFAQCTPSFSGGFQAAATGYDAGQSFTATCSGVLNYVQVTAMTSGTIPSGTLNIYAGSGTGTTPIYTQAHPAITLAQPGPVQIIITGNVPITNASQYTFEIFMTLDVNAGTGYTGGEAFQSGASVDPIDVDFEVDIAAATGINDLTTTQFSITPNPATNVLNIAGADQIKSAQIFSINGALVKSVGNERSINIADLDQGMYVLVIQTNNTVSQSKFIKE